MVSRRGRRHLPRRPHRARAFRALRRRQGFVQGPPPSLPSEGPVHAVASWGTIWVHPTRHCCAGRAPIRKAPSGKPVTSSSPNCRAEDLPFHQAALGWAQGPGTRDKTGHHRRRHPRCGAQLGAPGHPRPGLRRPRLGIELSRPLDYFRAGLSFPGAAYEGVTNPARRVLPGSCNWAQPPVR